jgi:hypothetical protein
MSERPADRLAKLVRDRGEPRKVVDLQPATAHEAVTRQMVYDLTREVGELRKRVDALFYLVVSAIVVDVLGRLFGAGLS